MEVIQDRKQKIIDYINSRPPAQRERLTQLIRDNNAAIAAGKPPTKIFEQELSNREKYFPLKNIIPNVAQSRALKCYEHPKSGAYPYPIYNFFTGANDVGKTLALTMLLAGCSLGAEFLNKGYLDFEFFEMMKKRRQKKALIIWIVCENEDMSETGSVYTHIKNWIPTAKFGAKKDGQFYKRIDIPAPKNNYHPTIISIKTFDQQLVKYSGTDCDLILINEPLPDEKKFHELTGRIRSGGYIGTFMTPLSACAYVKKIIDDRNMHEMVCHTKGNIWENCKDIPGMRGTLAKEFIDAQIAIWKKNPVTLRARTEGEFVHLAGAIFPIFQNSVPHVIPVNRIPDFLSKDDYVVQAVDHHPSKPAVGVWMKIDPLGNWHVIAEYPTETWDEIEANDKSIIHYGYDFKLIESGGGGFGKFWYMKDLQPVQERIGDPNAFKAKQSYKTVVKTIQEQYKEDCGLEYDLDVDNTIELRHDQISKLLYYDILRELSSSNSPKLYIYETCINVISALQYYINDDNGKPKEEWKDWIDCIGYIVTTINRYKTPKQLQDRNYKDDEFYKLYGIKMPSKRESYGCYTETQKDNALKQYDSNAIYGIST